MWKALAFQRPNVPDCKRAAGGSGPATCAERLLCTRLSTYIHSTRTVCPEGLVPARCTARSSPRTDRAGPHGSGGRSGDADTLFGVSASKGNQCRDSVPGRLCPGGAGSISPDVDNKTGSSATNS